MFELVEHRGIGHVEVVSVHETIEEAIAARAALSEQLFDGRP
jgi:hypothetical protein